jgi:hypothetical protein
MENLNDQEVEGRVPNGHDHTDIDESFANIYLPELSVVAVTSLTFQSLLVSHLTFFMNLYR